MSPSVSYGVDSFMPVRYMSVANALMCSVVSSLRDINPLTQQDILASADVL
jgi:hypothetical protein